MIIDICIVKATRSQNPAPNHCADCIGELPMARVAPKTSATARSASAKASGNQRSNQSERRRPIRARRELAGLLSELPSDHSQVLPLDQLHRQEELPVVLADVAR